MPVSRYGNAENMFRYNSRDSSRSSRMPSGPETSGYPQTRYGDTGMSSRNAAQPGAYIPYGNHRMLEEQNDAHLEKLSESVQRLHHITVGINDEVSQQNSMLRETVRAFLLHFRMIALLMGVQDSMFGQLGGSLNSAMRNVKDLTRRQSGRYTCYMMLFILFIFFALYGVLRYGSRPSTVNLA